MAMPDLSCVSKKQQRVILCIFFGVYLCLGLFIYKDYGVHWDEYHNQTAGKRWMAYIHKIVAEEGRPEIEGFMNHDFIHGSCYELFLTFVHQEILDLKDPGDIIYTRHLVVFLTFYLGVVFFYLLGNFVFKDWKKALLACCFLIIHPRIFAHSFYNSVDIPFLTFYIITLYTLLRFLENKTLMRCFSHALSCAILIDIRIAGLIVAQCTYIFILSDALLVEKNDYKGLARNIVFFSLLLVFLIVVFWPYLWSDPVGNFLTALKLSKFKSNIYPSWSYNFIWIAVTTPVVYTFLFVTGLISALFTFSRHPIIFYKENRSTIVAFSFFFIPLIMPVMYKTLLFDGWRHHYFVYPVFIVFAVIGLSRILDYIRASDHAIVRQILTLSLFLIIMIPVGSVVVFMVRNHPYQYAYGNVLSGKRMERAKFQNSLDYWGLSYRTALEYILKHDDRDRINIFVVNPPGVDNSKILKASEKRRLHYVGRFKDPDYFIGNYRSTKMRYTYPDQKEYFSVKLNGQNIVVVYKLRE